MSLATTIDPSGAKRISLERIYSLGFLGIGAVITVARILEWIDASQEAELHGLVNDLVGPAVILYGLMKHRKRDREDEATRPRRVRPATPAPFLREPGAGIGGLAGPDRR